MDSSKVIETFNSKISLYNYKLKQLEDTQREKESLIKEKESLDKTKDLKENLILTCKLIVERITYSSKAKLERFLTKALKSIFTDRDYEIKLVLKEDTKKAGLDLVLSENGVDQEITDAVGGGIVSTLGLLLQIYYIEVYQLNKIMFIDEGLKEISTGVNAEGEAVNYLNNLLTFLKWLAETKEYSLVIITHDNTVKEFANSVYTVRKGKVEKC